MASSNGAASRDLFLQRLAAGLVVPITFVPVAALILGAGAMLGIPFLREAGMALVVTWVPLVYGVGISLGFTDGDGMGALSVATGYFVMAAVARQVAGDAAFQPGVLGGLLAGALCTWTYNRVKSASPPDTLALYSGKRLGPLAGAAAGALLGLLFGWAWSWLKAALVAAGSGLYASGPVGVFLFGAAARLLLPTGLHNLLLQAVETMAGGWVEPASGLLVTGEYLRFLAGDPEAGRILSGFFLVMGFAPVGVALALLHEAHPTQRRRVAGKMGPALVTALALGVTEGVDAAFLFASPVLLGLHALYGGLASLAAWALEIRAGGHALPMLLLNWHRTENGWLLLPLGLATIALYYVSFRVMIRWLRPPVLGRDPVAGDSEAATGGRTGTAAEFIRALGGPANLTRVEACMSRLRLEVRDPAAIADTGLMALGASGVVRPGGRSVQVVVGPRAGSLAERIRSELEGGGQTDPTPEPDPGPAPALGPDEPAGPRITTILSPVTGRVIPLEQVPDPVFAGRLAGDGVAVEPTDGRLLSPAGGEVVHVFPGGHALGMLLDGGLELLIHIGIDTVELRGDGFETAVTGGDRVERGSEMGRFLPERIRDCGKSLVTPILATNPDQVLSLRVVAVGEVEAGEPLMVIAWK